MLIKSNKLRWFVFLLLATVAIAVHYLMFELRYVWYLNVDDSRFVHTGYNICVFTIILLWVFFPSRILVAMMSFATFLFPPLLRGDRFPSLLAGEVPGMKDWRFIGVVLFSILLLVGATELRRRIKRCQRNS